MRTFPFRGAAVAAACSLATLGPLREAAHLCARQPGEGGKQSYTASCRGRCGTQHRTQGGLQGARHSIGLHLLASDLPDLLSSLQTWARTDETNERTPSSLMAGAWRKHTPRAFRIKAANRPRASRRNAANSPREPPPPQPPNPEPRKPPDSLPKGNLVGWLVSARAAS